ncbi:ammonium transporter [Sphingosinicella sp. CPCC 101087]|uniref:ammonium transporter n=1 Tax=Sphingosinicella sp. CPCC 101087 TaxID=2497754 RepID=UPI001FB08E95|nr:ammonium transporter [Sphingosinicella sp. CPCC 101087]
MNKSVTEIRTGLAWAGGIVLLALGARFAFNQGHIDHDAMLRIVIGANGLMIAYFGNRVPKAVAPSACAQQVARFAGWSMVLSGLVYSGLWILAPIPVAITIGTAAVAAGAIATLGYCLRLRLRARNYDNS